MKNSKRLLLIIIILFVTSNITISQNKSLITGEVEKLAGDFRFTEGPAADAKGNIYFTDIPNHLILIWTTEGKLDTFRVKSGRANGLFFDQNGNLYVCEGEEGRITKTSPTGDYKTIASEYDGKRFNQPNDLWVNPEGGVYFTDPKYGGGDKELPQDGMHVYYISPDYNTVTRVCDDLKKPNGLIGTPDGKLLYVTDPGAGKTYKYNIKEDGSLSNKTLFAEVGCDGMTIDKNGNLYLTPGGKTAVDIYSPSGKLLESIEVPERPSNVCFGGKNSNLLYITARTSFYRVELKTKGVY
jgi:gluconolactonase